jgi:ferritin-like protein
VGSENFHERFDDLTPYTRDMHRAIVSLMEELEAIDWYQQRVDATDDEELKSVLAHNRDEEVEHAMMNLEWIRRKNPTFNEAARVYLFSEGPITEVEANMKAATGGSAVQGDAKTSAKGGGGLRGASEVGSSNEGGSSGVARADGSLGIGSLKLA